MVLFLIFKHLENVRLRVSKYEKKKCLSELKIKAIKYKENIIIKDTMLAYAFEKK